MTKVGESSYYLPQVDDYKMIVCLLGACHLCFELSELAVVP